MFHSAFHHFVDAAKPQQNDFSDDIIVPPLPILEFTLEPTLEPDLPWNKGGHYYLHCQGETNDHSPVNVYWLKDGVLINWNQSDTRLSQYINETRTLKLLSSKAVRSKYHVFKKNGTLQIKNADIDIAGRYQCIITNARGGLLLSNARKVTVVGE